MITPVSSARRRVRRLVLILSLVLVTGTTSAVASATAAAAPAGAPSGKPPRGATTHVMTWNIHGGHNEALDVATEIARARPQVVGVQEACRNDVEEVTRLLHRRFGLDYAIEYGMVRTDLFNCGLASSFNFGQAILSRSPMSHRVNRRYSLGGSERRGYLAVTTMIDGRPTRVINTHLAQGGQARVRAFEVYELVRATAGYGRVVLLGDLNADPRRSELQPLWRAFREVDPGCGRRTWSACTTTIGKGRGQKFDYIFLRGLTSAGFSVTASPYSDHRRLDGFVRSG